MSMMQMKTDTSDHQTTPNKVYSFLIFPLSPSTVVLSLRAGMVVQGVARLRFGELKPLYQGSLESKEVVAHGHYVNDSLSLYLFYFLQLSVMATYLNQDLLKLVPLLTIIFAIGR